MQARILNGKFEGRLQVGERGPKDRVLRAPYSAIEALGMMQFKASCLCGYFSSSSWMLRSDELRLNCSRTGGALIFDLDLDRDLSASTCYSL